MVISLLDGVNHAVQWCQDPKVLLGGLAAVSDGRRCRIGLQRSRGAALGLSDAVISPSRVAVIQLCGPRPAKFWL